MSTGSRLKSAIIRLFKPNATDESWEYFGKECPYFGVVTWPQNLPEHFDEKARSEFFDSGRLYLNWIFRFIREKIEPTFSPQKSLDFGCGVGRLLIPIARESVIATGVDVSTSMLKEAKINCQEMNVSNVKLTPSIAHLTPASYDFINSFIVFQHIPPHRGYKLFRDLLKLLMDGGIGAIQITYHDPGRRRDRILNKLYRAFPVLYGFRNLRERKPFFRPRMEMSEYSLSLLFRILHENGCHLVHTAYTQHGVLGLILIFQKAEIQSF